MREMDPSEELAATKAELAEARRQLQTWQDSGVPTIPTTVTPRMVEARQRAERERIAGAILERRERDARLAKEREQRRLERAAADLEAFKEEQLDRFVKAGGKASDWPETWKVLRQEYLLERMKHDPVQAAVEQLRASGRYSL